MRRLRPFPFLLVLPLASCGPAPQAPSVANTEQAVEMQQAQNVAAQPSAPMPDTVQPRVPTPDPSEPVANVTPPVPSEAAEPDGAAAADVVRRYYAAIEAGDYATAWRLREEGTGDPASFAAAFSRYAEFHAEVGTPGRVDAGAGQRFVQVPVHIFGRLKEGAPFNATGTVTLHRTADIPGATSDQRRWRIRDSDIKPVG